MLYDIFWRLFALILCVIDGAILQFSIKKTDAFNQYFVQ